MRITDLAGKKIALWGAGTETVALVEVLAQRAINTEIACVVLDEPQGSAREAQLAKLAPLLSPEAAAPLLPACDLIVRSPLVSAYRDALTSIDVPVTTATGLWIEEFQDAGVPMIGITGSKGKTTTTMLIAHLLRRHGETVEVAGNIGRPVVEITDLSEVDRVVLELSSYQITDMFSGPQIAVFTNIFREHIDWHEGFDNYIADKTRLASLPRVEQIAFNSEDARLRAIKTTADLHPYFGAGEITVAGNEVVRGGEVLISEDDFVMVGRHNLGNVAAALTAVELTGYDCSNATDLLADFEPPRHRLEIAAERDGVVWVDDNYSSTPESAIAALEAFPGPAVLLVGGRFRGQDHTPLVNYLLARDDVDLIGIEDSGKVLLELAEELGVGSERLHRRQHLPEAVALSSELASAPSTVIMSPVSGLMNRHLPADSRAELFASSIEALPAPAPSA